MCKKNYLVIFLIVVTFFLYSETSQQCENRLKKEISVNEVDREIMFTTSDSREFQENKIDTSILLTKLKDGNGGKSKSILKLEPITVNLNFCYFGFYKTSSGTWVGKSNIDVTIIDPYNTSFNEEKTISTEIVFKKKWRLKSSLRNQWSSELIDKVNEDVVKYLENYLKSSQNNYKTVSSYGKSIIVDDNDKKYKLAVLDALNQACILAWGMQIESTTTMIDLADIEEITKSTSKGLVLNYKVVEDLTTETEEGDFYIFLHSIILNPARNK